jgi:hypothetical protein
MPASPCIKHVMCTPPVQFLAGSVTLEVCKNLMFIAQVLRPSRKRNWRMVVDAEKPVQETSDFCTPSVQSFPVSPLSIRAT